MAKDLTVSRIDSKAYFFSKIRQKVDEIAKDDVK